MFEQFFEVIPFVFSTGLLQPAHSCLCAYRVFILASGKARLGKFCFFLTSSGHSSIAYFRYLLGDPGIFFMTVPFIQTQPAFFKSSFWG